MKTNVRVINRLAVLAFSVGTMVGGRTVVADEATVRQSINKFAPGIVPDKIVESPIPGLYEMTMGGRIFYISTDGRYLLQGNLLDLETREDLTEAKLSQVKKAALAKVSKDKMVVFAPTSGTKHVITVFTDIDCGYCRKLHQDMDDYLKEGFEIRYLFFPRAGVGSPSYDKSVSVWCAQDRKQAMTDAKAGKELPKAQCDNPVREHMHLGEMMGVTGTPSMVLEDGRLIPGFVPAKNLSSYFTGKD